MKGYITFCTLRFYSWKHGRTRIDKISPSKAQNCLLTRFKYALIE